MKLLIKLYKPDGTCEELRTGKIESLTETESVRYVDGEYGVEPVIATPFQAQMSQIESCLASGGRIEIAPIVE